MTTKINTGFNFLKHKGKAESDWPLGSTPKAAAESARGVPRHVAPAGAIVIYGEQGCGKTRRSKELLAHFNKRRIVDDWEPGMPIPSDAIALTNIPVKGAISFAEIKAKITSKGRA